MSHFCARLSRQVGARVGGGQRRSWSPLSMSVSALSTAKLVSRTRVSSSVGTLPSPPLRVMVRSLFIQTQSTPNANSLKFLPGRDVSVDRTLDFANFRAAQRSPLARLLFQIDGVSSVLLGPDFVTVNVVEGTDWQEVKPQVFAHLSDFFASGQPLVLPSPSAAAAAASTEASSFDSASSSSSSSSTRTTVISTNEIFDTDDDVVAMIKELIETRVRPTALDDGGDILFHSFDRESGVVHVELQGSCSGCSSSSATLKSGIERMLVHYIPEVRSVEEWKDEELETVSADELRKLEEGLSRVQQQQS